jgi:hypothetical protein
MSSRRYAWTAGTSAIEAAATDWRIASRPEKQSTDILLRRQILGALLDV